MEKMLGEINGYKNLLITYEAISSVCRHTPNEFMSK